MIEPTRSAAQFDRRFMANSFSALLLAGSTLTFVWALLPHSPGARADALVVLAAVTAAAGLWLRRPATAQWPEAAFVVIAALATVEVGVAVVLAGPGRTGFVLFFLWTGPWGLVFFGGRTAAALYGLNLLALTVAVLTVTGDVQHPTRLLAGAGVSLWLIAVGTLTMVGGLVHHLLRRTASQAAWLTAAFSESSGALVVIETDGLIHSANQAFAAIVDRPLTEIVGSSILDCVHEDDRSDCVRRLYGAHTGLLVSTSEVEKRILRGDGGIADVCLRPTLIRRSGRPPLFFAHVRDVTELKRSQYEAARAAECAARHADHQRSLATLSRCAVSERVTPTLVDRACRLAVDRGGVRIDPRAWVMGGGRGRPPATVLG